MQEGGRVPRAYEVAFLSDLLHLSWSQLEIQPEWWVTLMLDYYEQKGLAEQHKLAREQARSQPT